MAPPKYYPGLVVHCLLLFCFHTITICAGSNWRNAKEHKVRRESQNWLNHGGDLFNRRYAHKERKISPETAPNLLLKWEFHAGKDITATPAIFNDTLYCPSWNGYIYALKALDGSVVWKQNLQKLTGLNPGFIPKVNWTVSRSTPTVAADLLIISIYGPAVIIAVRRTTGELVWKTALDFHPASVITMSGTYYKGGFYIGTSSFEEGASIEQCCTFRGSLSKLDIKSGAILWQTFMLPDNHGKLGGYAGAAVWGSSPSIDVYRNHVYIATGNLYSVPLHIRQCQERVNNQTQIPPYSNECIEPDNHSNSMLALDMDSGQIKWYRQLGGYDVWLFACTNRSTPNCPPPLNLDADFGEAPMMLTVHVNGTKRDIVVAVQKSGFAWALDRSHGELFWSTEAGPGGVAGGGTWGAATDEERVYTNILNSDAKNFTLVPSNKVTTSGGWVAMDARDGKILWSIADPSNAGAAGPVSVANGVVFVGSTHGEGPIYAINAKTGGILWSYHTEATVYGGMSVSDGCIYVGHGYSVNLASPNFTPGTSLFAFCV